MPVYAIERALMNALATSSLRGLRSVSKCTIQSTDGEGPPTREASSHMHRMIDRRTLDSVRPPFPLHLG